MPKMREPIFCLTSSIQQALGFFALPLKVHALCVCDDPLIDLLQQDKHQVFCLERETKLNGIRTSRQLLKHAAVQEYLTSQLQDGLNLVFFKPTLDVSRLLPNHLASRVNLMNTSPAINRKFEDKVNFFHFAQSHHLPILPGVVGPLSKLAYPELTRVLGGDLTIQFGRGWAGRTTFFVRDKQEFKQLKLRYKGQVVRVAPFIHGETMITNACVTERGVITSQPFRQITGLSELTPYPGGTCGNQWDGFVLSDSVRKKIIDLTGQVGVLMQAEGFRGYFGLDFLIQGERVYLSEDNARLTASVPMYTQMELMQNEPSLLFLHLMQFAGKRSQNLRPGRLYHVQKAMRGFQLVARNTQKQPVMIKHELASGYYRKDKNLTRTKLGYALAHLSSDEFLLLVQPNSNRIMPGEEIFRLQSLTGAWLDDQGMIDQVIQKIYQKIQLKQDLR